MKDIHYLIVHKDHPFDPEGVNSGAENATRSLACALKALGKSVTVAAQLVGAEGTRAGVQWWDLGATFNTKRVLERMAAQGDYHLISAGRAQPILESRDDERCKSRVLISHDRSGNDTGISPKVLCAVADRIVCVSDAQREVFLRAGADPSKVVTLYNGVDLDVFAAGLPVQRNWKRLVFVGALVEDKGIHWLIESYCTLKQKFPDLTLDVYGTSGLWGRPPLFDERNIEQRVPGIKFHGKVSQAVVAEAFRTAGLCVIPSIWFDPFPLTALEAQATGCPVLTFDVGGLKEGVRDQETAVVLKEVNPAALTRALEMLLSSPHTLQSFSQRALEVCRPRFTWDKVAQGIVSLGEEARRTRVPGMRLGRIGVVSTWNQACGLATYARFLLSEYAADSYHIFAERASTTQPDESYVERCWSRGENGLEDLEQSILRRGIALVHLNVHPEFFPGETLASLVSRLKAAGVRVVAHLHNTFSVQGPLAALARAVDRVIVHADENRLQLVANGADPARIEVIPHGVHALPEITTEEKRALREALSIPHSSAVISAFGFVQPHKGMEGVIEGVRHLADRGIDARGYIIGQIMPGDPHSVSYLAQLKQLAQQAGVGARVAFLDHFIPEQELIRYLRASDVVLMNYRSGHYEASGACAVAVGAGALVVSSLAPPFMPFGEAVWHLTTGFPLALSLEVLFTNTALRERIHAQARNYRTQHAWARIAEKIYCVYEKVGVVPLASADAPREQPKGETMTVTTSPGYSGLKVLFQNRPNALTHAGGDTVVMDRTIQGLRARGVAVTVDLEGRADPAQYDIVHLFNFALPDLLHAQAARCVASGTPFVVTTLCEDVPAFHNQSWELTRILFEYVRRGQPRDWLRSEWRRSRTASPSQRFMNDQVAEQASALIANGASEAAVLKRDYPRARSIVEVPVGFEVGAAANPELFVQQYGVRDFILCVGRLESRKNQLMLLQALEDVDLPVVLVGGGFTYQPEYEQAVRAFKRRGQTLVLGRLTPELLASAYAACRMHALPSWYELPGLVSLEAASYGKNVVVTECGTTPDYFGEKAFYADPSSARAIQNAVLAAYYSPVVPGLRAHVQQYTWDAAAQRTRELYQRVLEASGRTQAAPVITSPSFVSAVTPTWATTPAQTPAAPIAHTQVVMQPISAPVPNVDTQLDEGEAAARRGDFAEARRILSEVERTQPRSARCLRSLGAVALAEQKRSEARAYFERALQSDAGDVKALVGLGMCDSFEGNHERGAQLFLHALERDPKQTTALHQLLQSSYILGKYDALERALRRYLDLVPTDTEFQFCLAGCLFKSGKFEESQRWVEKVLQAQPTHRGASELKAEFAKRAEVRSAVTLSTATPTLGGIHTGVPPSIQTTLATSSQEIPREPSWMRAMRATEVAMAVRTPPSSPSQSATPTGRMPEVQPSASPHTTSAFTAATAVSDELAKIEENKRKLKLEEGAQAADVLLARPNLSPVDREYAELLRAEIHSMKEEFPQATQLFDKVLSANPRSARALCGKGALAAHGGNWPGAEQLFRQALAINPNHDVACAGLGLCAAQNRNTEEAWNWYWKATQLNPESMRALLGLVELAYPLKRLAELEQALRAYLDMHPADLQFMYSLAGCLYAQNRVPEAKAEIEKIIIFEPTHSRANELKGMIEKKLSEGGTSGWRH